MLTGFFFSLALLLSGVRCIGCLFHENSISISPSPLILIGTDQLQWVRWVDWNGGVNMGPHRPLQWALEGEGVPCTAYLLRCRVRTTCLTGSRRPS